MTPQEAIKTIKVAISEVEWDYPMDYTVAFEEAIKALEKQMRNCGNCQRADRIPNYRMVYCRVHKCITSDDNCCRYWSDKDDI